MLNVSFAIRYQLSVYSSRFAVVLKGHRRELKAAFCYLHIEQGGLMAAVKITVRKNGPYRVEDPEGSIELVDADGNKYDLTGKPAFSLCRCGGSVNKPFCDGTHSRIGFEGADSAVKKAEGAS
jgi:CDGSH-type Zn-finger protein